MSYIKYITHVTGIELLDNIIKNGLTSTNIQLDYEDIQCIWFNYVGIYKDTPFYSNMPAGQIFRGKVMINLDFNRLLIDMYNQKELPFAEKESLPASEAVLSTFYANIGVYSESLRHDLFSEFNDESPYELSLNAQNVQNDDGSYNEEEEYTDEFLYGLSKLDNRLPVNVFNKLKENWNKIVTTGQELVIYNESRKVFNLNVKNYISNVMIYNEVQAPELREILDANGLSSIPIHVSHFREYSINFSNPETKTPDIKELCRNVKQAYNKKQIEKLAERYGISLPGRTKAELCMNLYIQLLMNP